MTPLISPALEFSGTRSADANSAKEPEDAAATEIRQRFEQMLWAEMLSHAGLEKAFTQGGGEAASAFSRYVVEEIARDLAEQHPILAIMLNASVAIVKWMEGNGYDPYMANKLEQYIHFMKKRDPGNPKLAMIMEAQALLVKKSVGQPTANDAG